MKQWKGGVSARFSGYDKVIPHGAVVKLKEVRSNKQPYLPTVFTSGGEWVWVTYKKRVKSVRRDTLTLCDPPRKVTRSEIKVTEQLASTMSELLDNDIYALVGTIG